MPLSDSQVEQQLTQRRLDDEKAALQITNLTNLVAQLQAKIATLNAASTTVSGGGTNIGDDIYQVSGGILHKLATKFSAVVTFVASAIFPSLTASRPLKLDAGGNVTSDKIDLAAPTTDVKNTLGVANGGTGSTSLTLNSVLLGNATSAIQVLAGVTGGIGLSLGFTTIQYKDWASANQSLAVLTSVTIDANAFTKGVRTT